MAILRRPLLISGALHILVAALVGSAVAPRPLEPPGAHEPAGTRAEIALVAQQPPSLLAVEVATGGGSAGRPSDNQHPAAAPAPVRRARAMAATAAVVTAPEIPEAIPLPATELAETTAGATAAEAAEQAPAAAAADAAGAPDGTGTTNVAGGLGGDGAGDGTGDGFGDGVGAKDGRGALHARVLGNVTIDVRPREGVPVVAHDEATALRERDTFPRLHERVWPRWQPYIVSLEVCVASTGLVSEVVLRSSASARLDAIVLAAVKTWRYRPRVIAGQPTPFCHGVVIKYERW